MESEYWRELHINCDIRQTDDPFLFIAPLLGDLVVRQLPLPLVLEMSSAVVIGGVYAAAGLLLRHPKLGFDRGLSSMRDLLILIAVTVVNAALVAGRTLPSQGS